MAVTVVRVKRKLSDDPVSALVLSFKRQRPDEQTANADDDKSLAKAIFHFGGSTPVAKDDDENSEHLRRWLRNKSIGPTIPSRSVKQLHVADIRLRKSIREDDLQASRKSKRDDLLLSLRSIDVPTESPVSDDTIDRSEIVNELSGLFDAVNEPESDKVVLTNERLSSMTCNNEPMYRFKAEELTDTASTSDSYAYDYYISNAFTSADEQSSPETVWGDIYGYFNELIAIDPLTEQTKPAHDEVDMSGCAPLNGNANDAEEDDDDDDEDSNAESNWRNEYPDEDDEFENRYDFYGVDHDYDRRREDEAGDYCGDDSDDEQLASQMKRIWQKRHTSDGPDCDAEEEQQEGTYGSVFK